MSFDFGHDTIKVAVGRYVKNELKVTQLFNVKTPEGTLVDGKINELTRLSIVLEAALTEHKVKVKDAIVCLNSTQIINREIFIPVVAPDEVETVARYEIQQFLPINLADYLVQYLVLGETIVNGESKYKLNVIAFPEKMAQGYYDLLKAIGLKPYALDVSFNAVGKLAQLANLQVSTEGTVAFVDMGAQSIDVNIYHNGNIQFTRMIKSGGMIIDENLSQIPEISIKSAVSLKEEAADLMQEAPSSEVADRIIRYSIDEMLTELDRVFQFYRNKVVGNKIDHIYVFGGTSQFKGLEDYMQQRFSTPTTTLHQLEHVELTSALTKTMRVLDYANALGAIIDLNRQELNFFKSYQTKKTEKKSQNLYLYTLIGATTLVIGGTFMMNTLEASSLEKQITALTDELNAPEIQDQIKQSDLVFQILEVLEQYDESLTALDLNVISRDIISTQKLDLVSSTIPSEVSFESLSMTSAAITISAKSKTREAIAEVQHNLKQLQFIDDVVIGSIGGNDEFSFSLNCILKEVG